jgi:hypothetical protein
LTTSPGFNPETTVSNQSELLVKLYTYMTSKKKKKKKHYRREGEEGYSALYKAQTSRQQEQCDLHGGRKKKTVTTQNQAPRIQMKLPKRHNCRQD